MALVTATFNGAQVFYVDPTTVNGARTADISSIDLWFKHKPDAALSLTGQPSPSVKMFVAEVMYDTPRITRQSGLFTGQFAQVFLEDVRTSTNATVPTNFRFATPITIETGKQYCFVLMYDMLAQFVPWKSVQGEILTASTSISPGPSSAFIGQFFDFNATFVAEDSTNLDEYLTNWRPIPDTSLKFRVNIARYAHGSVPVWSNGSIANDDIIRVNPESNVVANSTGINFNVNFGSYEYISFNENLSSKSQYVGGMMAFQNTVSYPGGPTAHTFTVNQSNNIITAGGTLPNGDPFQWSNIFPANNRENRVVIKSNDNHNVRRVLSLISNTVAELDEPVTFSNTTAEIMITPIGRVSSFNKDSPFGVEESFVMLANSTANSTVRFVNNDIESVAITAGGTGWHNNDILYVTGYEDVSNKVEGGYVAVANLTTNSTGGVTSVDFANLGCGFTNADAISWVIANGTSGNQTGNTANGSGLTLAFTVGSTIKTEYGNNTFRECVVRNLDIGEFIPYSNIQVPPGTEYSLKLETSYIKEADAATLSGEVFYVNPNAGNNQLQITMYDHNHVEFLDYTPALMSKSNEFNTKYEDGSANDKLSSNAANRNSETIKIISDVSSNSDYSTIRLSRPAIQFAKYVINNDATNEHTDSGNAYAKGLTKVIEFERTAEDLRYYATAYKPANTDIKVYARIYKNEDQEAFDDKNWTELELKSGIGLQSSLADPLDYVELEYGFYQVPPDRTPLNGTATFTGNANSELEGANTNWATDLAAGDLVYVYQPLFVENHFIAQVESVTNNTLVTLDFETSNSSILAEPMKVEKITYPEQAFNNKQNDNVVRYYNGNGSKFDGYESVAIKVVFLSDSPHKIPRIDDHKGTGVSA